MSNAVYEPGSPLADYLEEGDPTPIRPSSSLEPAISRNDFGHKAITGSDTLENVNVFGLREEETAQTNGHGAIRPSPKRALSSDRFSEQFKYLICSSALLEKDYVPGYRNLDQEKSDVHAVSELGETEALPTSHIVDHVWSICTYLLISARERWDITLAVVGLIYGIRALIESLPILLLALPSTFFYAYLLRPVIPINAKTSPAPSTAPPSPTYSDPRQSPIQEIKNLIESSQRLDDSIEKTLNHFTKQPGNISHLHALRLALSGLTTNMVDHLAGATSVLLRLGDKDELKVLGEMYDVQMTNNGRPGKRISFSSSDSSAEMEGNTTVPGPRQPRLSLSLETHQSSRYSLAMSVSRSFPGNPLRAFDDPDDRFTQMPVRTPRSTKRASREMTSWNPRRSPLFGSSSDSSPQLPSHGMLPSPFISNPKRRSLQHLPYNLPRIIDDDAESLGHAERVIRSPLSDSTRQITSVELPSPFTPNPKRRSLQNMPYNPSTPIVSRKGADLTRTRSMPLSDIQTLRSRYATGSHSRSSSLVPPLPADQWSIQPMSPNPRTPRIRRVVSVSPLTLASLKASCLDIHLRRRRVACCLLGLRFDSMDKEYWEDVVRCMRSLANQADEERRKLDAALKGILPDLPTATLGHPHPPWASADAIHPEFDFAPRTSDATLLYDRIEGIQNTLNRAWSDLLIAKKALSEDDSGNVEKAWKTVRTDLGEMVRDWEKGKEIMKRMRSPEPAPSTNSIPEHVDEERVVPRFAEAWSDTSQPIATTTSTALGDQPGDYKPEEYDDILPPQGQDMVFEATVPPAPPRNTATAGLSREERIKMNKSAREAGLSLKDYLERERDVDAFERQMGERERLKQGAVVVDELKGMMEIIRARKGGD